MPGAGEDPDVVRSARATVRRLYGKDLESKSSDDFCVTVERSQSVGFPNVFGLEALAPGGASAGPAVPSVVEFAPEEAVPQTPLARDTAAWSAWNRSARDTGSAQQPYTTVLRSALLNATRSARYQVLSPVYDEIERLSGTPLGPSPDVLGSPQITTLVTQVCWLNRTVRTWAGPKVLADVSADGAVTRVDVPRRLEVDANTANHATIDLPRYNSSHTHTGKDVIVAVIDSEVALQHPALRGRVVHRRNYTAEPWGNPHGHGTAVAGIIAANDMNDAGIAPEATIYNYKVIGSSRLLNSDDFGGALAIQQALEDGAAIANCSWGVGPVQPSKSREAIAVDNAWALGMAVVKSAGNSGPGPDTMTSPADADGVIVVGATTLDGLTIPAYSSRGSANGMRGPHVLAPGGDDGATIACAVVAGGFGDAGSGTSYAAPHVSGILALWLEGDPSLDPDQLRDRLVAAGKRLPRLARHTQGAGLVQVT